MTEVKFRVLEKGQTYQPRHEDSINHREELSPSLPQVSVKIAWLFGVFGGLIHLSYIFQSQLVKFPEKLVGILFGITFCSVLVAQSCPALCDSRGACQTSLFIEFSRREYWNGWPFPSPGDLPDPGTEPGSPVSQACSLLSEPPSMKFQCVFSCFHGLLFHFSGISYSGCPLETYTFFLFLQQKF